MIDDLIIDWIVGSLAHWFIIWSLNQRLRHWFIWYGCRVKFNGATFCSDATIRCTVD